jgi:hypothetical protein
MRKSTDGPWNQHAYGLFHQCFHTQEGKLHVVECIEDPYELRLIKDNAFQPGKNYLCEEPFSDVLSPSQPIDLTNMVIAVPQH